MTPKYIYLKLGGSVCLAKCLGTFKDLITGMADCLKLFKDNDVTTSEGNKFQALIVLGNK